jgi:hypothetical protein
MVEWFNLIEPDVAVDVEEEEGAAAGRTRVEEEDMEEMEGRDRAIDRTVRVIEGMMGNLATLVVCLDIGADR